MIQRVHEHIISELNQNARTDTIFVLTAIILNLITLGINSAVAGQSRNSDSGSNTIVMFLFIALVIVVNIVAILGLVKGRESRTRLVNGLQKMYKDQGVDGYYDPALLANYGTRYNLFILTVVFTGIIAIAVPLVIR